MASSSQDELALGRPTRNRREADVCRVGVLSTVGLVVNHSFIILLSPHAGVQDLRRIVLY